jgi:hypothetical protein
MFRTLVSLPDQPVGPKDDGRASPAGRDVRNTGHLGPP